MLQQGKREHKLLILRLWRDAPDDAWRLAIQTPDTTQMIGLSDTSALQTYIDAIMQGQIAHNATQ